MSTTYITLVAPDGSTETYKTREPVGKYLRPGAELVDYMNEEIAGIRVKRVLTTTATYEPYDDEMTMCFRTNIPNLGKLAVMEVSVVPAKFLEWVGQEEEAYDHEPAESTPTGADTTSNYKGIDLDVDGHYLVEYHAIGTDIVTPYIHSGTLRTLFYPSGWRISLLTVCDTRSAALVELLKYATLSSVKRDPSRPLN